MLVAVTCQECSSTSEAPSDQLGRVISCDGCGAYIAVPPPFVGPEVTIGGFKLIKRLGSGGMGEVFLAYQLSMERNVAIKILPPHMTKNHALVERFLHEARMSARLEHPNIVTVIDAGEDGGFYYIAMRYVEGQNLHERLMQERRIGEIEALSCGFEIVKALDFAWRHHKIFHRDIKPSNVMVDGDSVKVLDMGLAKEALVDKALTDSGVVMGTPLYMSPEQARGDKVLDFRTDVYSLGASLFHVLTGRPMFDGDNLMTIMSGHVHKPTPDPADYNSQLTPKTCDLIQTMTAKHPDDRCKNYRDLLLAFEERLLELDPEASERTTLFAAGIPRRKPSLRKRLLQALAIGSPIMLVILAIGFMIGRKSAPPPEPETEMVDAGAGKQAPPLKTRLDQEMVDDTLATIDRLEKDPTTLRQAIAELRGLAKKTRDTRFYDTVSARLERLERRYTARIDECAFGIRQNAWKLFFGGQAEDAVRYLNEYDGEMKEETQAIRTKLAKEFQGAVLEELQRKRDLERKLAELRKDADERYQKARDAARDKVAEALVNQAFETAAKAYRDILNAPDLAFYRLRTLAEFKGVEDLCQAQQGILESFRPHIGIRTTVALKEGKSIIIPLKIKPGQLIAEEFLQTGPEGFKRRELQLTPTDFTLGERATRLPKTPRAVYAVMVGLLQLEAGKRDKAVHIFSQSDLPVSRVIRRTLVPPLEAAWRQAIKHAKVEVVEPMKVLRAILASPPDTVAREALRDGARLFLDQWSRAAEAGDHLQVARLLAAPSKIALPIDLKADDRALFVDPTCLDPKGNGAVERQKGWQILTGLPRWVISQKAGVAFALIPPGSNVMGSDADHKDGSFRNERPRHRITVSQPFYMGRMEITQRQWRKVLKTLPEGEVWAGADMPVAHVTWFGARNFVRRLCHLEGVPQGTYRLPTEAEWEYACRAGTTGGFAGDLDDLSWNYGNSSEKSLDEGEWDPARWRAAKGATKRVARKKPNGWGLYDCHGNLMEWCRDWYGDYDVGWLLDPKGPEAGNDKVCRSGARHVPSAACRSATRYNLDLKQRGVSIGLRIVRVLDVPKEKSK